MVRTLIERKQSAVLRDYCREALRSAHRTQVATRRSPAARIASPVIQADSSDARNTGAISVTRPSRPNGVFGPERRRHDPQRSLSYLAFSFCMTESVARCPFARALVSVSIVPFVEAYNRASAARCELTMELRFDDAPAVAPEPLDPLLNVENCPENIDVSKVADVARVFDKVDSACGRLNVLVNIAGVFRFGAFAGITEESFHLHYKRRSSAAGARRSLSGEGHAEGRIPSRLTRTRRPAAAIL